MNNSIKKDILNVLKKTKKALENEEYNKLKEISNETIHNCTLYQDGDSINTAILVYSLYNLFKNPQLKRTYEEMIKYLEYAINSLNNDDFSSYNQAYKKIYRSLKLVRSLKSNIKHVIEEAEVKKGSRSVYHGLSVSHAADLFGISQWDLMQYLGKVNIYDSFKPKVGIKKRMEYAKEAFNQQ